MALREHTPYPRPQPERMRQHLENYVSICGSVAKTAQRSDGKCMRRLISKIEAAFQGKGRISRVGKSHMPGSFQPGEFFGVRCLLAQGLVWTAQVFKRRGHFLHRRARSWAVPIPA